MLELGEPRRQEGSDREGDKEAEESGNDHDDAVLPDQVADDSRDQGEGEKDRHVHHGDRDGRETDLAPSIQGRGTAVLPHLQVAVDVLENDDGVVHQDPDHQRHGQEGHQVQGEVEEVHGREGRDQGAGDGDHDDQGVADAVEEDQHDQGDQDDGEQEVFLDGVGRVEGEGGAVLGDGELQADLGVVPFKLLKGVPDSLADIDGVGIGLLLNQNPHRRLPVEAADVDGLLDRVLNLRNVAQADIPALSPSDDQVTQFVEALEAAGDPDDELSVDVLDLPCREVQVSGIDRLNDLQERKVVGAELLFVQVDPDLPLLLPDQGDLTYPSDLGEGGSNGVFEKLGEFRGLQPGGGADLEDGKVVQGDLRDDRVVGVGGEVRGDLVDLPLNLLDGEVDVGALGELDRDKGDTLPGVPLDVLHLVQRREGLFDDLRDRGLHDLWGGSRVGDHHRDVGNGDVRQEFVAEGRVAEDAEDDEGREDDNDDGRTLYGDFGECHFGSLGQRRGTAVTRAPSPMFC